MQVPRAPIAQTGVSTLMYVGDDEPQVFDGLVVDAGNMIASAIAFFGAISAKKDTPIRYVGYGMAAYFLYRAIK